MKDNDKPSSAPEKDASFEEDLQTLKNLVLSLESQTLDLDQAISTFEKGITLSRKLTEKLSAAERKLELISKGSDSRPRLESLKDFLDPSSLPFHGPKSMRGKDDKAHDDDEGKETFPDMEDPDEEDDDHDSEEFDGDDDDYGIPKDFFDNDAKGDDEEPDEEEDDRDEEEDDIDEEDMEISDEDEEDDLDDDDEDDDDEDEDDDDDDEDDYEDED
jgi:exodeoxyribonuclease VII small subunit